MIKSLVIACVLVSGIVTGGAIASTVYVPKLKCEEKVVVEKPKKEYTVRTYPKGTFEHEVKRTE